MMASNATMDYMLASNADHFEDSDDDQIEFDDATIEE